MSADDRFCPECGTRYRWYEETCEDCGAALVDARAGEQPEPSAALVPVFRSDEFGALDIARMTLDQAGIEYTAREPAAPIRRPADDATGRWLDGRHGAVALFVLETDASRARALLADLQNATAAAPGSLPAPAAGVDRSTGVASILLHDAERGTFIGRISESQLGMLRHHLVQESAEDRCYYIDATTIEMLADAGADETLVALLRGALGGREGIDVRWSEGA